MNPDQINMMTIFYLLAGMIFLLLVGGGILVFKMLRLKESKKEAEMQFQNLEKRINSLHLENLESKLNPHLFKNILNSIQSHAYQTYFALDKLANVLDYILYESRSKFVTPKEEIEFALNLIEINKIKISPLFDLKIKKKINDFEPLYEKPLLAPLISIDLIENAFKHADLQSSDAFISVVIEFKDGVFSLTVANKISSQTPLKKEKSGIGTDTLVQRLQILYKDNFKLERFVEENVFIAHLKINLIEHKAEMHPA
jgi:LytS/YehU family sensor histidine kinase